MEPPCRSHTVAYIGSEVIGYFFSRGAQPSKLIIMRATPTTVEYACSTHDYLFFQVMSREKLCTSTQKLYIDKAEITDQSTERLIG